MQMHIDPLHAPLTTTPTSSLFVINPQHQPLIENIFRNSTLLPECNYGCIRNQIQQLPI
jgi:hypothetical protein